MEAERGIVVICYFMLGNVGLSLEHFTETNPSIDRCLL